MKNLIQSKPFVAAAILAALCLSILILCFIYGKAPKFNFTPDNPAVLGDPAESWIETTNAVPVKPEYVRLDSIAEPEETEAATEKPEEEKIDLVEAVPDETLPAESEHNNDIVLTVMPEKPAPPELPETAYPGERTGSATLEDVAAHQALDPALTNPNVKPDGTPAAPKPKSDTPQSGNANNGGNTGNNEEGIYFPGFGWIPYTGPNIVEESGSDGDWNKQIGSMG